MTTPLVFSTVPYAYLGSAIAAAGGWEEGTLERKTFPDGEKYLRILSDPADRDVILVGGTPDDAATLELYDLACGLVAGGAHDPSGASSTVPWTSTVMRRATCSRSSAQRC